MAVLPTLQEWLNEQPFTLCLSSGFFGFFAHAGFISALAEADVKPELVSGASAGALTGGVWTAGLDSVKIRDELLRLKRGDFWDPGLGPGLLRGRLFHQLLEDLLPVRRLEHHHIRMKISTFDVLTRKTRVFEKGLSVKTIRASCAVPLMFHPVWINRRPYLDGGIKDRPAMHGVSPRTRTLYHHLPSRSGWRHNGHVALQIPRRPELVAIAIKELPLVGPGLLENGQQAFFTAYERTKSRLRQPVQVGENWL